MKHENFFKIAVLRLLLIIIKGLFKMTKEQKNEINKWSVSTIDEVIEYVKD